MLYVMLIYFSVFPHLEFMLLVVKQHVGSVFVTYAYTSYTFLMYSVNSAFVPRLE